MGASHCLLNRSLNAITNQFTPHTGSCHHFAWLFDCSCAFFFLLFFFLVFDWWSTVSDFDWFKKRNLVLPKSQCCDQQHWNVVEEKLVSLTHFSKNRKNGLFFHWSWSDLTGLNSLSLHFLLYSLILRPPWCKKKQAYHDTESCWMAEDLKPVKLLIFWPQSCSMICTQTGAHIFMSGLRTVIMHWWNNRLQK